MTCRYSWRYQLQEFSSHYHTVALDLRGCGDSDAPDRLEEYSLDTLLYDIRDTIDELGTYWLHHKWVVAPDHTLRLGRFGVVL